MQSSIHVGGAMIERYLTLPHEIRWDAVCRGPSSNSSVVAGATDDINVDHTVLCNGECFSYLTTAFRADAVNVDHQCAAVIQSCRQPLVQSGVFLKVVRFECGYAIKHVPLLRGIEPRIPSAVGWIVGQYAEYFKRRQVLRKHALAECPQLRLPLPFLD